MQELLDKLFNLTLYGDTTVGDLITPEVLLGAVQSVLSGLFVLIAGFVIAGWLARNIRRIAFRYEELDDTLFSFFANIVRYAVMVFTVLILLNGLGVQTASFVAMIGAAGLAIGLALQGTLSNVAAGVMIVFFRPFRLGDFIETSGVMGTVKDITLNYTVLHDVSNLKITVPNASIWGSTMVNYSANKTRRAEWIFGVGYGADLKKAEQVIMDTIMADERSLKKPEPFIQVNNLGDFSVDFTVRCWVKAADYFAYQADMKRQVKEALDKAGVEIPFPTTTIISNNS